MHDELPLALPMAPLWAEQGFVWLAFAVPPMKLPRATKSRLVSGARSKGVHHPAGSTPSGWVDG